MPSSSHPRRERKRERWPMMKLHNVKETVRRPSNVFFLFRLIEEPEASAQMNIVVLTRFVSDDALATHRAEFALVPIQFDRRRLQHGRLPNDLRRREGRPPKDLHPCR